MKKTKIVVLYISGFTLVFSIISLVFYFGDWQRMTLVSLMGAFVGLLAVPEFEPEAFKNAWLYQIISGGVAGGISGFIFATNVQAVGIGVLVGGFLGFTATYWVKHVQIP